MRNINSKDDRGQLNSVVGQEIVTPSTAYTIATSSKGATVKILQFKN